MKVYLIPLLVAAAACVLSFALTDIFNLDRTDRTTGYIISVIMGAAVWFLNKSRWLPEGDGSYLYIDADKKDLQPSIISHFIEPLEYDAEFRNSLSDQFISVLCGIVAIVFGIRIIKSTSIIFPSVIIVTGLFVLVTSYKALIDRKPKLKLSRKGLWTRKLGFQPWTAIKKTQVVQEKGSRLTQVYLEIYLKDSDLSEADYPDERFSFWGIGNSSKIEDLIEQFKSA